VTPGQALVGKFDERQVSLIFAGYGIVILIGLLLWARLLPRLPPFRDPEGDVSDLESWGSRALMGTFLVTTQPLLPDRQIRQPGGSKTPAVDGEPLKICVLRRPWPGSGDPGRAG
jgi:hypothetical protein